MTRSNKEYIFLGVWAIVIVTLYFWAYQPANRRFAAIGASTALLLFFVSVSVGVFSYKSATYATKFSLVVLMVSFSVLTIWEVLALYFGLGVPRKPVIISLGVLIFIIHKTLEFRERKTKN